MSDASQVYVGAVRAILIGSLRRHHPDFTTDDAAAIILTDFDAVATGMMAAVEAAFPKSEGREPGNAGRTGVSPGRGGAKRASTRKPSGRKPRARSTCSSRRGTRLTLSWPSPPEGNLRHSHAPRD